MSEVLTFGLLSLAIAMPAAAQGAPAAPAAEPAAEAKPARLEALVPADVEFLVLIDDLQKFLAGWEASPIGRFWADPAIEEFTAPLREETGFDDWDEDTELAIGVPLSELIQRVDAAALAIEDLGGLIESEGEVVPPMAVLLDLGDDDELYPLLRDALFEADEDLDASSAEAALDVEFERATEDFDGTTIHVHYKITTDEEGEPDRTLINVAAETQGVMALASDLDLVRQFVVDVRRGGAAEPLAETESYVQAMRPFSNPDLRLYLDLEPLMERALQGLAAAPDEGAGNESGGAPELQDQPPAAPPAIDPEALFRAMGLDAIQGLSMTFTSTGAHTDLGLALTFSENRGLMQALALVPGLPSLPGFVPADAVQASVTHFSARQCWDALKAMIGSASPSASSAMETQIQGLSQALGIDLEASLIGGLGNEWTMVSFLQTPDQPGQTIAPDAVTRAVAISLEDRQTFETAYRALLGLADPTGQLFEPQKFMDTTIRVLRVPTQPPGEEEGAPAPSPAFALTPSHLLVGPEGPEALRRVISAQQKGGPTLWERPDVQQAVQARGAEVSSLGITRTAALLEFLIELMAALPAGEGEDGEETGFDPTKLPSPDVVRKYFGLAIASQYKTERSFVVDTRLHRAD